MFNYLTKFKTNLYDQGTVTEALGMEGRTTNHMHNRALSLEHRAVKTM